MVLLFPATCAWAQGKAAGYAYFSVGDIAAKTPGKTSPGLLLMGGGREIEAAFQWFAAQAGHGHIVILRASGDDELQDWIYRHAGGVASVQTLIFHARAPASDPRVLAIVKHADGIFIAGGDQANYVRFWKGTPLNALINAHVRAGRPLGGTSAGLAILGEWGYGAMDGGSITSPEALRDPAGPAVTLVDHFISLAPLHGIITDTHFAQRERLGRLLAFVARTAKDHHTATVTGLGVDQDSALLVDAAGTARFLSWHADGHAWVVVPERLREIERTRGRKALDAYLEDHVKAGQPLSLDGYVVTGIGTRSRLRLPYGRIENAAFERRIDVVDGRLVERAPAQASAASVEASAPPASPAGLDGTEWRFVEVAGAPVPGGVEAVLRLRHGHASGKAGCNAFGASWASSTGGSAEFGAPMSTKMACLAPAGSMQVERGVMRALQDTTRIERRGDTLVLLGAGGNALAKLVQTPPH